MDNFGRQNLKRQNSRKTTRNSVDASKDADRWDIGRRTISFHGKRGFKVRAICNRCCTCFNQKLPGIIIRYPINMTAPLNANSREEFRVALRNAGLTSIPDDILTKGVAIDQLVVTMPRILLANTCVAVVALSQSLKVSSTALAEIWEAYSLTKNVQMLDAHSFAAFRLKVMNNADVRMNDSAVKVVSMVTPHANHKFGDPMRRVSLSPAAPQFAPTTSSSSTLLSSYSERKDAGKVLCQRDATLRSSSMDVPQTIVPKCRISTELFQSSNVPGPYRHWYTVLDDRSAALDRQYHAHVDAMSSLYPFGTEGQLAALEEVGVPRQETVCCIGRIVNVVRCAFSRKFHMFHFCRSSVSNFDIGASWTHQCHIRAIGGIPTWFRGYTCRRRSLPHQVAILFAFSWTDGGR
jgi:hypothetical protein